MELMDYITLYRELAANGVEIIKSLNDALERSSKKYDGFSYIKESKENDGSINFQFLDFRICIKLKICTLKEKGYLEWYRYSDDPGSKDTQVLIISDSFDRNRNIKASANAGNEYHIAYATKYFIETIMAFCEKVDLLEFDENSARLQS
jgi:hypothetical protein